VAEAVALPAPAPAGSWAVPGAVRAALAALTALTAAQLLHDVLDVGSNDLFDTWIAVAVELGAAALCFARSAVVAAERWAWAAFGLAILSTGVGDAIWGAVYAHDDTPPLTSVCDVFWLAWYPLLLIGFAFIVGDRVKGFELHRWVDGLALAALCAAPMIAFVLEPVVKKSGLTGLDAAVTYAYPVWDILVVGAAFGVFALLGWQRPSWALLITAALTIEVIADSIYAVQTAEQTYARGAYDWLWSAAVLLIAIAAWQRPGPVLHPRPVYGWKAILLPLTCQVGAIVYGIDSHFYGLWGGELALALGLLVIVVVKVIITRPRPPV
jgi:hypothetical protein